MLLLDQFRQHPVFSSPLLPSVVHAILKDGPISRAQIARQVHLSKQTSSELVSALEQLGWVQKTGKMRGEIGRRAEGYEFNPESAFVLGIDVGGTKLHVALADHSGTILVEEHQQSDNRGGLDLVRQVGQVAHDVTSRSGIDRSRLFCAVIGIPGTVQDDTGRILLAPNIPMLDEFDVVSAMRETLGGLHVLIENDVNLAAVGESWNGLTQTCDDNAFISLGTGIGMGLVTDGHLLRGRHGAAGEIGYLPIGADPFDVRNRRRGAFESAVGSEGIRRRYVEAGGAEGRSVREIFDALPDDKAALSVIDDVGRDLAVALVAIVALVDPKRIVLGGSIGARPEMLAALTRHLRQCLDMPPEVTISRFGNKATTIGAIGVALDEVHRNLFGVNSLSPGLMLRTAQKSAGSARENNNAGDQPRS